VVLGGIERRIVAEPRLVLRALVAIAGSPQDEVALLRKDPTVLAAVALRGAAVSRRRSLHRLVTAAPVEVD
jgi:hypothetical protein